MGVNEGPYRTKIIEKNSTQYCRYSPLEIINHNCTVFGSSLAGRAETVTQILNSRTRLPIPIYLKCGIFMFPTTSMRNHDCMWISYYQVLGYRKHCNRTLIFLKGNTNIFVNISLQQFDTQIKRTSQVIAYFHGLICL